MLRPDRAFAVLAMVSCIALLGAIDESAPYVAHTVLDTVAPVLKWALVSRDGEVVVLKLTASEPTVWAKGITDGPLPSSIKLTNCVLTFLRHVSPTEWHVTVTRTDAASAVKVRVPASYCADSCGNLNLGTAWNLKAAG